jgi:hypothetical protein
MDSNMFKPENFGGKEAQVKLATLLGVTAFPAGGNIEEVNDLLEKVKFNLQLHSAAPQYVLTRALYPTEEGGSELKNARFTLRPAVSHELFVDPLNKHFTINAGEDFFDKFISEMAEWFDLYQYAKQLQVNVTALNAVVAEVVAENEIPFTVQFSLGDDLIDASESHVVVGITEAIAKEIGALPLFDVDMESRVRGYKAKIVETLQQCTKPYDIVKVKSLFTKDLGIYSRRSVNKLMRNFVNRKIEFVRVGTGYVETEQYFAVIDKKAVSEDELANLDTSNAIVVDNEKASSKEKEAGKTKIVVSFRIAPFTKEEGTPADVKLAEVI